MGIFADQLAAAMNPSVAGGNHAAVHVERQVIRWFAEMIGLPSTAMGILVSGGSMANLTALAAARHAKAGFDVRVRGLQSGDPRLVVYMSEEGHGCIRKAAEMLGIGAESLRVIPVNERLEMRVDVLAETIDRDLQDGYRPIAVAASAGTVNTGAIDDLAAVARVCRDRDVWFHVDGAYGAAAVLSSRYRERLASLALADSVALDPHKWLYVPVEAGLVLVRDGTPASIDVQSGAAVSPNRWRPAWRRRSALAQRIRLSTVARISRAQSLDDAEVLRHDGYARAIDHDLALASYLGRSGERGRRTGTDGAALTEHRVLLREACGSDGG